MSKAHLVSPSHGDVSQTSLLGATLGAFPPEVAGRFSSQRCRDRVSTAKSRREPDRAVLSRTRLLVLLHWGIEPPKRVLVLHRILRPTKKCDPMGRCCTFSATCTSAL